MAGQCELCGTQDCATVPLPPDQLQGPHQGKRKYFWVDVVEFVCLLVFTRLLAGAVPAVPGWWLA